MMTTEGEFKKRSVSRVRLQFSGMSEMDMMGWQNSDLYERYIPTSVLDEARKDFPKYPEDSNDVFQYAYATYQWSLKWFGEEKK
jgi:hypothetical protein